MREIHTHKVNPANDKLIVEAHDEPGDGGANHRYFIGGFLTNTNASAGPTSNDESGITLLFQNGPILEKGVNGITHEVLLAIVIDRLKGFQSGKFACRENALALTKLEEAAHWLNHRTVERMQRGVEGTHQK